MKWSSKWLKNVLGWKKDFEQVSTNPHVHAYSVITHEQRQLATNDGYHWNSIDI